MKLMALFSLGQPETPEPEHQWVQELVDLSEQHDLDERVDWKVHAELEDALLGWLPQMASRFRTPDDMERELRHSLGQIACGKPTITTTPGAVTPAAPGPYLSSWAAERVEAVRMRLAGATEVTVQCSSGDAMSFAFAYGETSWTLLAWSYPTTAAPPT